MSWTFVVHFQKFRPLPPILQTHRYNCTMELVFPFLRVYVFIPRYLHLDTRVSSVEFEVPRGTELPARGTKTVGLRFEGRQAFHWQVTGVQGKKQLSCINSLTVWERTRLAGYRGPAKTKRIDHRTTRIDSSLPSPSPPARAPAANDPSRTRLIRSDRTWYRDGRSKSPLLLERSGLWTRENGKRNGKKLGSNSEFLRGGQGGRGWSIPSGMIASEGKRRMRKDTMDFNETLEEITEHNKSFDRLTFAVCFRTRLTCCRAHVVIVTRNGSM